MTGTSNVDVGLPGEGKLPWREADPLDHYGDEVDSDQ